MVTVVVVPPSRCTPQGGGVRMARARPPHADQRSFTGGDVGCDLSALTYYGDVENADWLRFRLGSCEELFVSDK